MRVIESINDLKAVIKSQHKIGKTIGFVPTMGYLHAGHISLVKASQYDNEFTIISIFVNPIQFGPGEDFEKYPRDMNKDLKLAEEVGVDVVFIPSINEMYPEGYETFVNVNKMTRKLCGRSRNGHFKGVTTIVNKLFNIVEPSKAYFGQKDAQQALVIKRMVKDLNMNIEIITCPIVREEDGLALSSRNVYLNFEERRVAPTIYSTLQEAKGRIEAGLRNKSEILEIIKNRISSAGITIDYIEILKIENLVDLDTILQGSILIAVAAFLGKTRLIDNIVVEV